MKHRGGYESPQLRTVPVSCGGMLCLSAGESYMQEETEVLDFYHEGTDTEDPGNRNDQFSDWSNGGENSFF
ncbi:MAG: hypothetical protein AUK63_265 [bacterium P3]|nr:MAG: hypothetical protein AUK63_265 [bacterium P3]